MAVTVVESPDPKRSGLDALSAGAADLALASNLEKFRPDVALVLPLYPTVLHIAHRADLVFADTVDLLTKHRVFAGPPNSPSRLLIAQALAGLGMAGYQPDYVEQDACADVAIVFAPIRRDLAKALEHCDAYRLRGIEVAANTDRQGVVNAIALRKRGQAAETSEERQQIVEVLKAMQDSAFEMLVHEKLAADESFRIFITLIHDSVAELERPSRGG